MKKLFMCAVMITVLLSLTACAKVKASTPLPDFSISTSISNVPDIYIRIDQTTTKRNFQSSGYFSSRNYDLLGEIDSININVIGTISRSTCPVDTDFFRLLIKAPDNTTSVILQDITYSKHYAQSFNNDGYFETDVLWLYNLDYYGELCGNEKANCFYIAFFNDHDEWDVTPLAQYFVYITYDLTFID